jgi:FG-GAP-like repeat/Secretion system C-terminal sorting domain
LSLNIYPTANNYYKTLSRLEKSIRSGTFASYTLQRKRQLWNRLSRYAKQLGITIKSSIVATFMATGLSFATPASAQPSFVLQTGALDPFNGADVGFLSAPTFVDIDGDGDLDAFVGGYGSGISFYKNTGTATAPVYTLQPGASNPLNAIISTFGLFPTFVDIDGDGDKDLFVGQADGSVAYYKNTGTALAAVFTLQVGAANPLSAVSVGYYAAPVFVDIDGDGDMDAIIGTGPGNIQYFKNTGTALAPVFVQQVGAANPLDAVSGNLYATAAFADLDNDGDMDVIIGGADGTIAYYENTGSATVPAFTNQVGAANPFNGIVLTDYTAPSFADIDGDGDQDAIIGSGDGSLAYFKNTSPLLPLNLLAFNGTRQPGFNLLQWQTASEINTRLFEVERSIDSRSFVKIATIKANGSGNNSYTARDNSLSSGKIFYRLKMIDIDGRFTYSPVIWINSGKMGISISPNPTTNLIRINTSNPSILQTEAGIYDIDGRLMRKVLITSVEQPVNVQPLAKGSYLIKFADGSTQRFVKN